MNEKTMIIKSVQLNEFGRLTKIEFGDSDVFTAEELATYIRRVQDTLERGKWVETKNKHGLYRWNPAEGTEQ